jgi:hypothetical protein
MAQHRGGGLITTENYESLISQLAAANERIAQLEALVRRFVAFDPYPDSTLTPAETDCEPSHKLGVDSL